MARKRITRNMQKILDPEIIYKRSHQNKSFTTTTKKTNENYGIGTSAQKLYGDILLKHTNELYNLLYSNTVKNGRFFF